MEYKEIVAVTGEPGLFQLVSSKSDGAIVRTLDGQTTKFVPSRNHNFTPLESIEVFTTGENVALTDVFHAMQTLEEKVPVIEASKDGKDIKQYFLEVYPTLDEERVYVSDMKKMLKWYPLLKNYDLLKPGEAVPEEMGEPNTEDKKEDKKEDKTDASLPPQEKTPMTTTPVEKEQPAAKASEKKATGGKTAETTSATPGKKEAKAPKTAVKKPKTNQKEG